MENIILTQEKLMELYSDYILRNGHKPLNVFVFSEDHGFSEADFYAFYGSFEALEADYLKYFLQRTLLLISADETYAIAQPKMKLLTFYYTFIEQLTLNRTLVTYLIGRKQEKLDGLKKTWALRPDFLAFVRKLSPTRETTGTSEPFYRAQKLGQKAVEELYWNHFLSVLKFWLDDSSRNFERTDIFIEKSVDTGFEVLNQTPVRKVADLAKFLFNDKIRPHL